MLWLFDFFGLCHRHWIRTEWDGAQLCYVCPSCEREPSLEQCMDALTSQPYQMVAFCKKFGIISIKGYIKKNFGRKTKWHLKNR